MGEAGQCGQCRADLADRAVESMALLRANSRAPQQNNPFIAMPFRRSRYGETGDVRRTPFLPLEAVVGGQHNAGVLAFGGSQKFTADGVEAAKVELPHLVITVVLFLADLRLFRWSVRREDVADGVRSF